MNGNKRVALATAATFLWLNGYQMPRSTNKLETLTLGVASGKISKAALAHALKKFVKKRKR